MLLIEEANSRAISGACPNELDGWNVTLSSFIHEGIKLCETSQPDVVLMDASKLGAGAAATALPR
ncbi:MULTISPECIES: hypothetical protein [Cyanophyceae]|uniref:hypothetical protein n=1 Tax=Cyanophyceae TaxID=3028117 RepID=UPI001683C45F|nr:MULTISPECIES: hypothetical protein [Cyanophyceae]MBD1915068.1 hypothetical protein [Phormidium sp. FACHB-77]MBD2030814.1 hypothetical protein [Phormidium sp. FACHB-322]MBD2053168.1 hypothetical protein [Leptolyngbya sp. FACHB-60]